MSETGESPLFDLDNLDLEGDCDDDVPLEWIVLDEEELADNSEATPSIHSGSELVSPEADLEPRASGKDCSPLQTSASENLNDAKASSSSDDASMSKPVNQAEGSELNKSTTFLESDATPVIKKNAGGGQIETVRKRPWGPLCKRKNRDPLDQEPSSSSAGSHGKDAHVSSDEEDDRVPVHIPDTSMLPLVILERIDKRLITVEGNHSSHSKSRNRALFHEEDSGSNEKNVSRNESGEALLQQDSSGSVKVTLKAQPSSQDRIPYVHRSSSGSGVKPSGSESMTRDKSSDSGSSSNEKMPEPSSETSSSGKHSSHSHGHKVSHKSDQKSEHKSDQKLEHKSDQKSEHKLDHKLDHQRDHRNSSKSEQPSHRERTVSDGASQKDSSMSVKTETPNHQERLSSHSSRHDQRRDSTSHNSPKKEKPSHGSQGREETHASRMDHHQPLPNFHVPKLDRRDSSEGKKGKGLDNRKQQSGLDILKTLYEPPKVQAAQAAGKEGSRESLSQAKRSEEKDLRSPQLRRLEKLITSNIWGFELCDEETLCRTKTPGGPPQWLMSIAQLTADDLSQDEAQNLITLSVSSQWISSKSSGKRFGKLLLLFDNTKSMKVAMKSLLQIKPASKNQKVTLLRSRTKERDPLTKDQVEFQLFTCGDTDISSDTVCVEPSINHGHWKGKVNSATLLMENVPVSLDREMQADILQVLFPFAYLISISSSSKDSAGCNAILKHRREETVSTHVSMMRNIFIAGRMQRIKQMGPPTPHRRESNERRGSEHQESKTTPKTSGDGQITPQASSGTPSTASPSMEELQVTILLLLRTKAGLEQDIQELMRLQGSEATLPSMPLTSTSFPETKQQLQSHVEDLIKVKQVMELMVKGDFLKQSDQTSLPSDSALQSHLSHLIAEGHRVVGLAKDGTSSGLQDKEGTEGRHPLPMESAVGVEHTSKEGSAAPEDLLKKLEMQMQTSAASSFIPAFTKQECQEEGTTCYPAVATDTARKESGRQQGLRSEEKVAGDSQVTMGNGLKRKMEPSNELPQKQRRQSDRENIPKRNFGPPDSSGRKTSPAASPGQTRGTVGSAQQDRLWPRESSLLGDKDSFRRPEKLRPSPYSSRDSEGRRRDRQYEESDRRGRESRAEKGRDYSRRSGSLDRMERDYLLEVPDRPWCDPYLEDRRDVRVSLERDPHYFEDSRSRPREGLLDPTGRLMADEPFSRSRMSPGPPSISAGKDLRNYLLPEERDPLFPEGPHSLVRDRDTLQRKDHHVRARSSEYFDRPATVEEEDRARYTSRSFRDYEEPPERVMDRYPGTSRSEDFALERRERRPETRGYRGSEERDLPGRERLEEHRGPPRRTLLHEEPRDAWPAERPRREAVEGQPGLLPLPPGPEVSWSEAPLDREPWRKDHPDDYREQYAKVEEYDRPEQWEERLREPPPPRRERKQGRLPRQEAAPPPGGLLGHAPPDLALEGVPPPAGLLGHAPPDHAFQAAPPQGLLGHAPTDHPPPEFPKEEPEEWHEKPGLLGPPPVDLDLDHSRMERPVREHRGPPRDRKRPPRDLPPREPQREGLLGPGPEGFEADLPPPRRPGPGLLGEAPPEAYYEVEDHHPLPWPGDGLLGEAPPPSKSFEPEHRLPPPPLPPHRRPRERTPVEAPCDSYDNPSQPPPARHSGKARSGKPRPPAYEYDQEPPPYRGEGLLGAGPSEPFQTEEHPPRWPREGLLGRAPSDAYGHEGGEGMEWERGQGMEWERMEGQAEFYQEPKPQATTRRKSRPRGGQREELPPPQRGPPLLATPLESMQYEEQQYGW